MLEATGSIPEAEVDTTFALSASLSASTGNGDDTSHPSSSSSSSTTHVSLTPNTKRRVLSDEEYSARRRVQERKAELERQVMEMRNAVQEYSAQADVKREELEKLEGQVWA